MREIKYKIVDEEEGVVYNGNQIEADESFVVTLSYGELCAFHVSTAGDYTPMKLIQFTGLKDKNGVEIYEGDIVKGHWWERGNKHRHIGRVTYVMNAFKVRGVKKYLGLDDDLNPTYEIIGNIHENPNLLEGE